MNVVNCVPKMLGKLNIAKEKRQDAHYKSRQKYCMFHLFRLTCYAIGKCNISHYRIWTYYILLTSAGFSIEFTGFSYQSAPNNAYLY